MSASLRCPGCRRRVRVPAGTDAARSRCSKCRTRLRSVDDDAYEVFAAAVAPDPHPTPPPAGPLSLDECEPITTVGAPTVELAPPFKVPARVVSRSPLFGPVTAVLTPFGLFLEREPNTPLAFAPVGTRAAASGRALGLQLAAGQLLVILPSRALAADAAAFLAGKRPAPAPADYATPGWVLPSGLLLVLVLAAAAFVGGAALYVALRPPPVVVTPPAPPPVEPPPVEPPPPPPGPEEPPTHYDLAYRDGVTRLADGPAAVTALAVTPDGTETVVGYADGTTWAWRLDEPAFEPPRVGPRGVGPVRRINFGPGAELALLTGDTGLSLAAFRAPRATVHVPGRPACAIPDPDADVVRFAALRGDKLALRYVALGIARNPPPARVKGGVLAVTANDEITPLAARVDPPAVGATFVAWHPAGKVVYGLPSGAVMAYPTGVKAAPLTRAHKAPVRAWAVGPVWPDFATGDEYGLVGVWPGKALGPFTLQAGAVAVTGLAFSPCGGELAVADESGAVAVWNLPTRAKVFETVRRPPVVVAYGPRADVLLISDGGGVEVWSLAALGGGAWP